MKAHNLTGSAVVAPPEGYFDPDLLGRLPASTLMLLSDHGDLADPPLSRLPTGQDLVLTDERAVTGGPLPNHPRTPLALRQRILSEAALEVTKGGTPVRPLVFSFPASWNPGLYWRDADFFGGLAGAVAAADPAPARRVHAVRRGAALRPHPARRRDRAHQRRRDPHPDAHQHRARPPARQRQRRDRPADRRRAPGLGVQRQADARTGRRPGARARRHHPQRRWTGCRSPAPTS